ncbi:MAG: ATP-binding cassette domain-containing protein [Desulfomonile tiedjei]|nr:ATP-binding cassette domain-containing protein [Desulfomonile tiedjei]
MENQHVLVELIEASLRIANHVVLSGLNWMLRADENWAILGRNGAGKTSFMSLVRGDVWPAPGSGKRLYHVNGIVRESPIGFRDQTGVVSPELLDRYKLTGWNVSGLEAVCTGFHGTAFLYDKPTDVMLDRARELLSLLGLEELSDRRILSMSLGEANKILIARALVRKPRLLFLDEVSIGLDRGSKATVLGLIRQVAEGGTQILYAAHDPEEFPLPLTHSLTLRAGRILHQEPMEKRFPTALPASSIKAPFRARETAPLLKKEASRDFLVRIENADVTVNGNKILHRITWNLKPGENWAVFGRNGSGKTTLLKLVVGELRPAWGGSIRRFGEEDPQRISTVRRRVSLVTPDLQASHLRNQTALEMVLSGFYGSVGLHQESQPAQMDTARGWFRRLAIEHLEDRDVRTLSYGQVRLLLILRGIVFAPQILLLDEPLSGLDTDARGMVAAGMEHAAKNGASLVYVTHDGNELVPSITHVAILNGGRLVFQGTGDAWHADRRNDTLENRSPTSGTW